MIKETGSKNQWLSIYLYPGKDITEFLRHDLLGLLAASLSSPGARYFFVRYSDRFGPHLRLRIFCPSEAVSGALAAGLSRLLKVKARLKTRPTPASWAETAIRIRYVNYRPEVSRYGGRRRLPASEEFFCGSSHWVLKHGDVAGSQYSNRLVTAAACAYFVVLCAGMQGIPCRDAINQIVGSSLARASRVHGISKDAIAWLVGQACSADGAMWSQCFRTSDTQFFSPINKDAPFARWKQEIEVALNSLMRCPVRNRARLVRILPNWVHMHNNRLGIAVRDEALIACAMKIYIEKGTENRKTKTDV